MPASKRVSRRRTAAVSSGPGDDFENWSHAITQLMQGTPDAITGLIETLLQAECECEAPQAKGKGTGKKAERKRMSGDDLAAHANLLVLALEELRYVLECNRKDAIAQTEHLRQYLLEAGQRPGMNPNTFLFVLQQFAAAKVDIGNELRGLAERIVRNLAVSSPAGDAASVVDLAKEFAEIANSMDGNPFAVHAAVSGFTQALPADVRTMLVTHVLAQKDAPALRDAALGWLLDDAAEVRQTVAQKLEKDAGNNGGTTLRRMIALRNWVPEAGRPALDLAIKASQKKAACASWPSAKVLKAFVSGFDGGGAQSVFMIVAQGRKRALAAMLFKQGIGVRDAWVEHGSTQAEVNATLDIIGMQMDLLPAPLEYIAFALRHFLGVNAQAGVMPPFGLLEVAEVAGLTGINPEFQLLDVLLPSLAAAIAPERKTPQAIAESLKASAAWDGTMQTVESWFEQSDEVEALLGQGRLSKAKRKAALLAMPMQKRRRWWAALIAWTGCTMKYMGETGWADYVLVARELLGERPLEEFGIMNKIAEATIAAHSSRR